MIIETATGNLRFEPFRKRVHTLGAHTVQTTGELVSALAELTASMQVSEYQFDRRNLKLRMNVDRDSAAVVSYRDRSIDVDSYINPRAKSGQVLIDRVVKTPKKAAAH